MAVTIQVRRDTAANWVSVNPVLNQGEPGLETDTGRFKYGDGSTAWTSLGYAAQQLTPTTQTTTYTANPGDYVKANISSASWTMKLPNAPAANTIVGAKVIANATGNTNTLTVACQGSDVFEQSGGSTSTTLFLLSQAAAWQYNSGYWTRISDDLPLGQLDGRYGRLATASTYTADQYFKSGRPWFDVVAFGADYTGGTDSTSAINSAISALGASGGTIYFPPGVYVISGSGLSVPGLRSVIFRGAGALNAGAGGSSALEYTGTSGPAINAQSSYGICIQDLMIYATNGSFTGKLIDFSHSGLATDSAFWHVERCYVGVNTTAAGIGIYLDDAIDGSVEKCYVTGGEYGIQGVGSSGHYSNAILIQGNVFGASGTMAIQYPGQGWNITGNTFEPLAGGAAGGVAVGFGAAIGAYVTGNWFGDNSGAGTWITCSNGFVIEGNFIGGSSGSTGVSVSSGVADVVIRGNAFITASVGISLASTATDIQYADGNYFSGVTTKYTASTVAAGAAAGSSPTIAVFGSDYSGELVLTTGTGATSGTVAVITFASTHGAVRPILQAVTANVLTAGFYVSGVSGTTFTISAVNALSSSATYELFWSMAPN